MNGVASHGIRHVEGAGCGGGGGGWGVVARRCGHQYVRCGAGCKERRKRGKKRGVRSEMAGGPAKPEMSQKMRHSRKDVQSRQKRGMSEYLPRTVRYTPRLRENAANELNRVFRPTAMRPILSPPPAPAMLRHEAGSVLQERVCLPVPRALRAKKVSVPVVRGR